MFAPAIVYCSDRLYGDFLYQRAAHAFPETKLQIVHTLVRAAGALKNSAVSLLIIALDEVDGDAIDLLLPLGNSPGRRPKTVVVVQGAQHRLWSSLRHIPLDGVFDTLSEDTTRFDLALFEIKQGRRYRSPSLDQKSVAVEESEKKYQLLSPTERLIFAILGDGSDDPSASRLIGMTVASVQSVRKSLHRKLGISHKGELVRLAAQYGLVRFVDSGVIRNGLSVLVAEYLATSKRPVALSPILAGEICRSGSLGSQKPRP